MPYRLPMTPKARRITAVTGSVLAGLGVGTTIDGLLAAADRYLTAAYTYQFGPFRGINYSDTPNPVPTLASPIFPIVGAILGLGIGLLVAALIRGTPEGPVQDLASSRDQQPES